MNDIMNWKECEKNFIRKAGKDPERIKSILEKAELRIKRAENTPIRDENISFIIEDYYEIIKELLIVYMLKNGLRSKNHQCLISFLYKKHPEMDYEIRLISQLSYYRNRLDYYGETVPKDFHSKNIGDIKNILVLIKGLISNEP